MSKLRCEAKVKIESLKKNVNQLYLAESPIRSEFRIPLKRFLSMSAIIDFYFSDNFIQLNTIILDMDSVTKLLRYWIAFLTQPIMDALSHISATLIQNDSSNSLINYIPTISAFESLLVNTLFSGSRYSFVSNIIWNNRRQNSDFESFELSKSIKTKNRFDFNGTSWLRESNLIQGSEDLLDQIIKKNNIKNGEQISKCYTLLYKLRGEKEYSVKADLLWQSYLNHLWTYYKDDFNHDIEDGFKYSCQFVKISENVRWAPGEMSIEVAIAQIFDIVKQTDSSIWSLPFLVAYKDQSRLISDKKKLDLELNHSAVRQMIQYIHHAGGKDRFFAGRGIHSYQKLERIQIEIQNNSNSQAFSRVTPSFENPKVKKQKEKPVKFTDEEKIDFCRGLNIFGTVGSYYSDIAACKDFGFFDGKHSGKIRTNTNLKDLHSTMRKTNQISQDKVTGLFYYVNTAVDTCRGVNLTLSTESPVQSTSYFENLTPKSQQSISEFLINTPISCLSNLSSSKLQYLNLNSDFRSPTTFTKRPLPINYNDSKEREKISKIVSLISDEDNDKEDKDDDDKEFLQDTTFVDHDINDNFLNDLHEQDLDILEYSAFDLLNNLCYQEPTVDYKIWYSSIILILFNFSS
jgi:hypothetical protein